MTTVDAWINAMLGRIMSNGVLVELEGAINFVPPLVATRNVGQGRIDVSVDPDALGGGGGGLGSVNRARAVSTVNVARSGEQTIDGAALVAGDVVLLAGQSDATENGPWVVAASSWARPSWFAPGSNAAGLVVIVTEGSAPYAETLWSCTADDGSAVVGTGNLYWMQHVSIDVLRQALGNPLPSGGVFPDALPAAQSSAAHGLKVDLGASWSGSATIPAAGSYSFMISAPAAKREHVRLYVDGVTATSEYETTSRILEYSDGGAVTATSVYVIDHAIDGDFAAAWTDEIAVSVTPNFVYDVEVTITNNTAEDMSVYYSAVRENYRNHPPAP